jgi:hypothetical protein
MKVGFEGELILRYLDRPVDGKWFEVVKPFSYRSKAGYLYVVPDCIYTDFASIPRAFRWMIARVGKYGKPAVLHDWLCEFKIVPRKKADQILLEAMKVLGVSWWKRRTMYFGVRAYSVVTRKK